MSSGVTPSSSGSVAGLQAQISSYRSQLNDWVTCVSASTPRGKAQIQSISGKISAAKEQISKLEAVKTTTGASSPSPAPPTLARQRSIDVWA